jgi:hypothetical protein
VAVTWPMSGAASATLLLAGLGACSTLIPPEEGVSPTRTVLDPSLTRRNPSAGLLIVRREQGAFGADCVHRIFLDRNPVADLRPNEMVTIYALPGEHSLGLKSTDPSCEGETELKASIERGKSRRFDTTVSSSGFARMMSSD